MTPEGRVKQKIKRALADAGAYWHMPVQNGLGAPTLDFVGCHRGRYFAVEAKAGGKPPTPRQRQTMQAIESAAGRAFLVNDVTGFAALLAWLKEGDSDVAGQE
jgi:hypothetical protein